VAIAESFRDPRVAVHRFENRRGLAGNWNRAFELASTPYVVIAHQDDRYLPDHLSLMLALIKSHPRAFAAHSRAFLIDEAGARLQTSADRFKERFWPDEEPYERTPEEELRVLEKGNYIICPSVIYRMAAVRTIGPFDEAYQFVTDWELWLRGLLAGFTLPGTHQRLIEWRRHSASATTAHEQSMLRYDEELSLLEWLAHKRGKPVRTGAVERTLLSGFAACLSRGNAEQATRFVSYARTKLPKAWHSRMIMNVARPLGRLGGLLLQLLERIYVRFASPSPHETPRRMDERTRT
jgi:GT2 family glycosyltransferase